MTEIRIKAATVIAKGRIAASYGILLLCCMCCSESLPPYQDPRDILEGILTGRYVLMGGNSMTVDFVIRNAFDETLEAQAIFQGEGQIVLQRNNDRMKTFSFSVSNMVAGTSNYNSATGILTLDPGASVTFRYTWNFIDDTNVDLRQAVFQYVDDPTCSLRRIAYEETFVLRAQMKVFERINDVVSAPSALSMCYVTAYVIPSLCPPILTDQPCSFKR